MLFGTCLLLALLSLSVGGCGTSSPPMPSPGPVPTGAQFQGVWYSPQFEQMYLRRTGDKVRGVYTYKYGGTFEGEVQGNLLMFKWIEPGKASEARRDIQGRGYFELTQGPKGPMLKGRWGYNEDAQGGGPWTAERIRDLEEGDPVDIKEFREGSVR